MSKEPRSSENYLLKHVLLKSVCSLAVSNVIAESKAVANNAHLRVSFPLHFIQHSSISLISSRIVFVFGSWSDVFISFWVCVPTQSRLLPPWLGLLGFSWEELMRTLQRLYECRLYLGLLYHYTSNTAATQIYVHAVRSQIQAHISVVHIYQCTLALRIVNTSCCRATILAVIQMH